MTDEGLRVVFATPDGQPATADPRMLTGKGLGPLSAISSARKDARMHYASMAQSAAFQDPLTFEDASGQSFDGLILPGGHAEGMRPYLESTVLQALVTCHMEADKPLGAICHGVIVVARASHEGRSMLHGRRTTALPASMELSAWRLTCLWLGRYYRTYEQTVQDEVTRAVGVEGRFEPGPKSLLRDRPDRLDRGFTIRDRNLLSARWPGDAYRFAHDFLQMLRERA